MYRILIGLICLQFVISCSSFSKQSFKNELIELSENNFKDINGSYKSYPSQVYEDDMKQLFNSKRLKQTNTYQLFNLNYKINLLDSLNLNANIDKIEINFINAKEIEIEYYIGNTVNSKIKMKGELKKGFFYLDDAINSSWGIPLLFGGYNTHKRRLGFLKNGNIILNSAYNKGGGLLFIFSNGSSYNVSYEIKKV